MKVQIEVNEDLDYEIRQYMAYNKIKRKDLAIPEILELYFLNAKKNNVETKE